MIVLYLLTVYDSLFLVLGQFQRCKGAISRKELENALNFFVLLFRMDGLFLSATR
jgi:hypothetical protein